MHPGGGVIASGRASATLTLSGETISAFSFGSDATAQVKVDNDGNVYRRLNNASWVQIDTGTDWIRPTSAAPDDYECRYTNRTGTDPTGHVEDTWYALTSDFILTLVDTGPAPGGRTCTFTLEIRKGSSGSADVSGSYTLNAEREDF